MGRTIALVTDFGLADPYVGQLKGVLRDLAPDAAVIDLCHGIPPGCVPAASFVLETSRRCFPAGTVFLAVVDPGVGGERAILIAEADGQVFIGPDNGILTPVLADSSVTLFRLQRADIYRQPGRSTFEGRERMAPAAARLAGGASPADLGVPATDPQRDPDWRPERRDPARVDGRVVYIDRFGNVISNVPANWLPGTAPGRRLQVRLGGHAVDATHSHYAAAGTAPFWLIGSHGNLELACNGGSAAAALGAVCGQPLQVEAVAT